MMITIRLAPKPDGRDRAAAIWNHGAFVVTSTHGVTMALARDLVAAGCPDQPWQAVGRDQPPAEWHRRLAGPGLHRLALTVSETDRGIKIIPWSPDTRFPRKRTPPDGV